MKLNLLKNKETIVMGILNITPDSFYDGGVFNNETAYMKRAEQIINEGGTIIDIGALSSRPGSKAITTQEEEDRLFPALQLIRKEFPNTLISIDTYRASIAKKSADMGADIINDISGGTMDNDMPQIMSEIQIPYILMHMQGTPETMQNSPQYNEIINDIITYFNERITIFNSHDFNNIILDPGFGFGKTITDNYNILKELNNFKKLGYPILAGVSRKSMITKVLNNTPQEALNGTTILNTIAVQNGADILRVHDVKEAVETIKLVRTTGY